MSNYEIRRLIGEGAMGWVYLAEHPILSRKAAVKVLRRAFAEDRAQVTRFIDEARAVNALRHPGIIDVIDVGRLDDGQPYLLMEYLEGETLRERLRRKGRLPLADALATAGAIAAALGAAHARGIVHAGLKPENVFLALDGAAPRVKVLDFGLAKLRGDRADSLQTGGALLGTPVYLSPEQCRGPTLELDARSDVYALGTILYEMLCGRPPFQSEAHGEVFVMQLMLQPTPPRSLAPHIPAAVEAVILRALAKAPADRPAGMAELSRALEAAAAAPVEPPPPPPRLPRSELRTPRPAELPTPTPAEPPTPSPAELPTPSPGLQVPAAALPTPGPERHNVQGVIVSRPATVPVEPLPLPSMSLAPSLAPLAVMIAPLPAPRARGRRLAGTLAGAMALLALLALVLILVRWPRAGGDARPGAAPPRPAPPSTTARAPVRATPPPRPDRSASRSARLTDLTPAPRPRRLALPPVEPPPSPAPKLQPAPASTDLASRPPRRARAGAVRVSRAPRNSWMDKW